MTTFSLRGPSWTNAVTVAGLVAPLTAFALQVGTGGDPTVEYLKRRGEKGYVWVQFEGTDLIEEGLSDRTPSENLAHIRAVLKPTVTELANLFGVSRQSIYGWQDGTRPLVAHANKLEDLAKAMDVFVSEGLTGSSDILRRKITAGKNLFDIVRDGGSAQEAVRALVRLTRRELAQRSALGAKLRGHARRPIDQAEMGAPAFDEKA